MGYGDNFQSLFHIVRDFGQVFFIFLRDQHCFDPTPQRGQQLLLKATDGQDIAAQRHLARHSNITAHGRLGQNRHDRRHHRNPCTGAIFRGRPFWNVDMDIPPVQFRGLHANFGRDRTHIGTGRIDGFLHHIAKLTRGFHAPLARQAQRLNRQQITAHTCPSQPCDNADLIIRFRQTKAIAAHAKHLFKALTGDCHRFLAALEDRSQGLAGKFRNFAL